MLTSAISELKCLSILAMIISSLSLHSKLNTAPGGFKLNHLWLSQRRGGSFEYMSFQNYPTLREKWKSIWLDVSLEKSTTRESACSHNICPCFGLFAKSKYSQSVWFEANSSWYLALTKLRISVCTSLKWHKTEKIWPKTLLRQHLYQKLSARPHLNL